MSEHMVRKVVCDHLCGAELMDVQKVEALDHLLLQEGWCQVSLFGEDVYHFCSLECLAQWAASKVGKTLMNWQVEPGALASQAAAVPGPFITTNIRNW